MATKAHKAFVLVEMLMVIGLIALMAGAAMISFGAMWGNLRFKRQAEQLVAALQMAQNAAAESDRRYAVVLDFSEQAYVLREFETLDLQMPDPQEAIIQTVHFTGALTLDYVLYDDLEDTRDAENVTEARFLAGKSGWQYGGKIALLDEDGRPWTIVVHRFAKPVELFEGDVEIFLPQYRENVPF
ncbi:MAG: type II secretion system GspH family protein [Planctomycetales bacterium]|nr:type II secretion system GspH family protein [Planctomycetales bacterium]